MRRSQTTESFQPDGDGDGNDDDDDVGDDGDEAKAAAAASRPRPNPGRGRRRCCGSKFRGSTSQISLLEADRCRQKPPEQIILECQAVTASLEIYSSVVQLFLS